MALLVHLNGTPGIGKSTIARRVAQSIDLSLVVDIDDIRVGLAGRATNPPAVYVRG